MMTRGAFVEGVWHNMTHDFPYGSGPVFTDSWLTNWITSYNLHRSQQWNITRDREYYPINTESLHHVQQIVILLDTLGFNITTTSLSQFSCFLPSRLVDGVAKPPLSQTSGMVMMGEVCAAQTGLKKKLDSTTIKVLAGLVQDFMVSVYTLNSLCVV